MIGDQPIEKGDDPVRTESLPRAAGAIPDVQPANAVPLLATPAVPAGVPRPLGMRRISFAAWGLAGVVGIGLWVALFKLI
jgi:hypothetical protein